MNQNPLISVIVPNYNHARFLKQRLDSVFNQSYSNFEVIILDDCSTDESKEVIHLYNENSKLKKVILNEKNSGASVHQWKKGIENAGGDFIWFAESDDYCELNFLERMVEYIRQFPKSGIFYCQSVDVDENGVIIQNRINYTAQFNPNVWESNFTMIGNEFIQKYQKVKNVIPNASSVLFKRNLVLESKVWNTPISNMRYGADWLFWIRLLMKTEITFIADSLNFFREHKQTTRIHDVPEKIEKRVKEEILLRNELQIYFPELNQDDEWELIYAKWFGIQSGFPYFNTEFYSAKKNGIGYREYIQKFNLFRKKKRLNSLNKK